MDHPKEHYQKPTLVKHQMGLLNKFGRIQSVAPTTHIDGLAVSDLVEKYGSPLFVFSERTMVKRCRELKDLLALHYPKFQLAWSYKTNYLDAICKMFDREGSWAEVVSEFEYEKAVRLGVSPSRIIFNGPYKPEAALEKGFKGGARIHIDHFDELSMAEKVADRLGIKPEVGLRINLSIGSIPNWERFGFNLESGQAWSAVKRLIGGGKLRLGGLHCHIGTFILDPAAYREAAIKMVDVDTGPSLKSFLQSSFRFVGPVKNDPAGRNPEPHCLFIFKFRNDFSPGALPVKHLANRIQIIRLVRPGQLKLWIMQRKKILQFTAAVHHGSLRKNKKGGIVFFNQVRDGQTINMGNGGNRLDSPKLIREPHLMFDQRWFLVKLFRRIHAIPLK